MAYAAYAFPILYLNYGGELIYIIEQRLHAQEISAEKSTKVLNDLLATMLNRQYLNKIFRPGRLNSRSTMKVLMEDIVHASIMRLGQESLDKLYELVTMSVKFQLFTAPDAKSILNSTVIHVESWAQLTENPETILQIQLAKSLLITHYAKLSSWAWMNIRYVLLNYLQACKTRVTIFLNKGWQNQTGHFNFDYKRPLPEGVALPTLSGRYQPYNFQCDEVPEVVLGSNVFNDIQRLIVLKPLNPLERVIEHSAESNGAHSSTKTLDRSIAKPEQVDNYLQLELKADSAQEIEIPQVAEETLLDLFDLANSSDK